jgi:hypothetical protein
VPWLMPNQRQRGTCADLLIEIGCEELPPKSLDELREACSAACATGLERERIAFDAAGSRASHAAAAGRAAPQRRRQPAGPDAGTPRPRRCGGVRRPGKPTAAARGFRPLGRARRRRPWSGWRPTRAPGCTLGSPARKVPGRPALPDARTGAARLAGAAPDALGRPRLQLRPAGALAGRSAR